MLAAPLGIPISMLLGAGTLFCLAKALRQDTLVNRVNYILHTLMGLGMLGMVWHQIPLPLLPQLLIFALASFWFLLQTVAHPAMPGLCRGRRDRITCLYHAGMLAAMVLMLAVMPRHTSAPTPTAIPVPHHGHGSHANEGTALTIPAAGPGTIGWLEPAALTLAALFAAAMLAWLLLPRSKTPSTAHQTGSIHRRFLPAERAYEAGTALTMALMFSAIAVHS